MASFHQKQMEGWYILLERIDTSQLEEGSSLWKTWHERMVNPYNADEMVNIHNKRQHPNAGEALRRIGVNLSKQQFSSIAPKYPKTRRDVLVQEANDIIRTFGETAKLAPLKPAQENVLAKRLGLSKSDELFNMVQGAASKDPNLANLNQALINIQSLSPSETTTSERAPKQAKTSRGYNFNLDAPAKAQVDKAIQDLKTKSARVLAEEPFWKHLFANDTEINADILESVRNQAERDELVKLDEVEMILKGNKPKTASNAPANQTEIVIPAPNSPPTGKRTKVDEEEPVKTSAGDTVVDDGASATTGEPAKKLSKIQKVQLKNIRLKKENELLKKELSKYETRGNNYSIADFQENEDVQAIFEQMDNPDEIYSDDFAQRLAKQCKKYQEEFLNLSTDYSVLAARYDVRLLELQTEQARIEELQRQLKNKPQVIDHSQKLAELQSSNAQLQSELATIKTELEVCQKSDSDQLANCRKDIKTLKQSNSKQETEIANLKEANDKMQNEKKNMQDALDVANANVETYRILSKQQQVQIAKFNEMKKMFEQMENMKMQKPMTLALNQRGLALPWPELVQYLAKKTIDWNDCDKKVNDLERQRAINEKTIADLTAKLPPESPMEAQFASLEKGSEEFDMKNITARLAKLDTLQNERNQLQNELEMMRSTVEKTMILKNNQIREIEEQLTSANYNKELLEQRLQKCLSEPADLTNTEELQDRLSDLNSEIRELESDKMELYNDLEQCQNDMLTKQEELNTCNRNLEALQAEKNDLEVKLDQCNAKVDKFDQKKEEWSKKFKEILNKVKDQYLQIVENLQIQKD